MGLSSGAIRCTSLHCAGSLMSNVPSQALLDGVDLALEDCRKMEVILQQNFDASPAAKSNLANNMENLMGHVQQLWADGDCTMEIPDDVLTAVDQGENPEIYTRDTLNACKQLELELNGKLASVEAFREALEAAAPTVVTEEELEACKQQ